MRRNSLAARTSFLRPFLVAQVALAAAGICRADTTDWLNSLDSVSLRGLPNVHSVTVFPVPEPTRRIIHIADQHPTSRSQLARWLRTKRGRSLSNEEIDAEYDRFRKQITAIQDDQFVFLQSLVRKHRIRVMYLEGLARDPEFTEFLGVVRDNALYRPEKKMSEKERFSHWLAGRAVGRLFLSGGLKKIRGVEPTDWGAIGFGPGDEGWDAFNEKREEGIVETLLSREPVVIVVLGLGHDLGAKIKRLSENSCEYIRVETRVSWEKRRGELYDGDETSVTRDSDQE